ncbi:MAG: FixH family protein [Ignavibacteriaceae bacterium]
MKRIKFSWGIGIIIACIVFMSFTIIIGITLMNQKVDLVTDNYYEKELKYQDQIDKLNRTELVKDGFDIIFTNSTVMINYKDTSRVNTIKGDIFFYRPSDSAKDFKLPISLDKEGRQSINTDKMEKGFWKVQLSWAINTQEYYFEKPLLIN